MKKTNTDMVYFKAVEAAKYLGLTIDQFLKLKKAQELPAPHFFGIGYRWRQSELDRYRQSLDRKG